MTTKPTMKGLPKDFPDVNDKRYWESKHDNANPDGIFYDPTHTIFFIRDYMSAVKTWIYEHHLDQKVKVDTECDGANGCPRYELGDRKAGSLPDTYRYKNDCPFCYKERTCWVKVMIDRKVE